MAEGIVLAVDVGKLKLKISFKSVETPTSRDRVAFPTWKVEPFRNCSVIILSSLSHHWQWHCPSGSMSSICLSSSIGASHVS